MLPDKPRLSTYTPETQLLRAAHRLLKAKHDGEDLDEFMDRLAIAVPNLTSVRQDMREERGMCLFMSRLWRRS